MKITLEYEPVTFAEKMAELKKNWEKLKEEILRMLGIPKDD